ncbi:MAG: hypothetical protein BWY31_02308 [Lentisphaerae bacterium ADurb.Bin242]|nr:MAG: hypothetical protein BWY31_02308 [Lentisphaerae bacterium ADurb.Bin242]
MGRNVNTPAESFGSFLDLSQLASLPTLELRARYLVRGLYAGMHRSPFRGANAEFKEHREYFPGDPVSDIDWKVYARTDRLVVRLREEDADLSAALFVDGSASMDFKDGASLLTKWEYACALAAGLMFLMRNQKDRFTLSVLGHEPEKLDKPSNTPPHFTKMLGKLRRKPSGKDVSFAQSLSDAETELKNGSILLLISDFYMNPEELAPVFDRFREKQCELLLFHIMDGAERFFPYRDTLRLEELESGAKMLLSPDLLRKEYLQRVEDHLTGLSGLARAKGGSHSLFTTDRVPLEALGTYLSLRNQRLRRFP